MSDECDERQEGACPSGQARTVLLRLGAAAARYSSARGLDVVWCVVGSCFDAMSSPEEVSRDRRQDSWRIFVTPVTGLPSVGRFTVSG